MKSLKRTFVRFAAALLIVFGGMPTFSVLPAAATGDTVSTPKNSKTVERNDDGTYKITLRVDGEQDDSTDYKKANVIVVLDTSKSMDNDTSVYCPNGRGKYGLVNGEYVRLYYLTLLGTHLPYNGHEDHDHYYYGSIGHFTEYSGQKYNICSR